MHFFSSLCIFLSRDDDNPHAESINSDLHHGLLSILIVEFLRIQILTDRTNGTRTRTTQMLTYKFVEICSTPLTTAPRRHATAPRHATPQHILRYPDSNYCCIPCLNDHNNKTVIKEQMYIVPLRNFQRVFYCLHIFINDILLSFKLCLGCGVNGGV